LKVDALKKDLRKIIFFLMLLALLLSISINTSAQVPTDSCQESVTRINDLQKQVEKDQQAIRNLRFDKSVAEAEEWEKLSAEAKNKVISATLNAYLENVFAGAQKTVTKVGSFTPFEAQELIGKLNERGINDPYLWETIRALGRTKGKPTLAREVNDVLERTDKVRQIAFLANSDEEDKTKTLQGLAMVLEWGTNNPAVGIVAADVEAFAALAYAATELVTGNARIKQLTQLAEQDLNSLKDISALLESHVRELRKAKQELNDCKNAGPAFDFDGCLDGCLKVFNPCHKRAMDAWFANTISGDEMIRRGEACAAKHKACMRECEKRNQN
jgi:hypothetical protein